MALFAVYARQPGYATSLPVGLGAGNTIALAPLTNVVMTSTPDGKSSLVSAVNNWVTPGANTGTVSFFVVYDCLKALTGSNARTIRDSPA